MGYFSSWLQLKSLGKIHKNNIWGLLKVNKIRSIVDWSKNLKKQHIWEWVFHYFPSFLLWLCPKNRPQVHSCSVKTLKGTSYFAQKNWEIGILWGRECRRNPGEKWAGEKDGSILCKKHDKSPVYPWASYTLGQTKSANILKLELSIKPPTRSEPTS